MPLNYHLISWAIYFLSFHSQLHLLKAIIEEEVVNCCVNMNINQEYFNKEPICPTFPTFVTSLNIPCLKIACTPIGQSIIRNKEHSLPEGKQRKKIICLESWWLYNSFIYHLIQWIMTLRISGKDQFYIYISSYTLANLETHQSHYPLQTKSA